MAAGEPKAEELGDTSSQGIPKRSLTPSGKTAVEFWHQGEGAIQSKPAPLPKRLNHARRADQLAYLLAIVATVVLMVLAVTLYLTNKKYSYKGEHKQVNNPTIDFYQGNLVYRKKFQEEKDAKAGLHQSDASLFKGANVDLEISLKDQMESMNAKLEKMRSQKLLEEPPIPPPDKGLTPTPILGVKPTDLKNFNAPVEFNGMLPKPLQ
jgi:hypothetical protein